MRAKRMRELRLALVTESISYGELAEIEEAFAALDPATLRDLPENATASDMLDEIEEADYRWRHRVRTYRGVLVHRETTSNSMGLRWWAYGTKRLLRADTLGGMRELIRDDLGVRQS